MKFLETMAPVCDAKFVKDVQEKEKGSPWQVIKDNGKEKVMQWGSTNPYVEGKNAAAAKKKK